MATHWQPGNSLALVVAGFREFFVVTSNYISAFHSWLSTIPFLNKAVAVVTLIISSLLVAISRRPRSRRMELDPKASSNASGGLGQTLKKWRIVKFGLFCVDKTLNAVEYLITPTRHVQISDKLSPPRSSNGPVHPGTPYPTGMPTLLNLRHLTKSTDGETPNNNIKPFSDTDSWTPFSSVSDRASCAHDDRASACVSLMDDLSQSTISATPIGDMRQQLVFKIRTWRHAIKDIEGTPEFPTWSPSGLESSKPPSSFGSRMWNSLTGWFFTDASKSSGMPGSARKRKRLDGDENDDDLALYLPQHKSQPPRDDKDLRTKTEPSSPPGIRGLSVVPIIGNWYSEEGPNINEKHFSAPEQDHISLIQHAFLSPSKRGSQEMKNTVDSEPYEVLDMEDVVNKTDDPSADQSLHQLSGLSDLNEYSHNSATGSESD